MSDESSTSPLFVESLVHQCYHYIAMNLEKFPVTYLSLLPLKIREELLWRLPIADMCLLEDTEYVKGFQDMAAYWKHPCEDFQGIAAGGVVDIDFILYEKEWDKIEYAKAVLYGQVVTALIGCLFKDFRFHLPFHDYLNMHDKSTLIPFLYAVRKPLSSDDDLKDKCRLLFPARYYDKSILTSKKGIINAIVDCFKGELPKILTEIDIHQEKINYEYYELLTNVVCLGMHGDVCESPCLNFVRQVVQRSTCLEIVFLKGDFYLPEVEPRWVGELVTFLSTQVSFLSRFRLLKIHTHNMSRYSVSQENLNKLIMAYFSAPTTHLQKIVITNTEIYSFDDDVCPTIDQHYLQFKIIEVKGCRFILNQKPTRRLIAQWLGQDISTLHVENMKDGKKNFCNFKIKEQASDRKRKYSEVDSEDNIIL